MHNLFRKYQLFPTVALPKKKHISRPIYYIIANIKQYQTPRFKLAKTNDSKSLNEKTNIVR